MEEYVICQDTFPFNEDFIKSYNEEREKGYSLEFDVQYPEKLHELHHDLRFLPEKMKLEKFTCHSHNSIIKSWINL